MTGYWDFLMHDSPAWATYAGYPGLDGELEDMSYEAIQNRESLVTLTLKTLKSFVKNQLSPGNQLNLDLLLHDALIDVEGLAFPSEYLVINQMGGVHGDVTELIRNMPRSLPSDYENILSRMQKIPRLVEQNLTLLKTGLKKNITPPKVPLRHLPGQIQALITDDLKTNPLLEPFLNFPKTIPEAKQTEFKNRAIALYSGQIKPVFILLHDFIKNTYLPQCRDSVGLSALPNGLNWYALKVKAHTTTTLTPDEIHNLGLKEVARIRHEMETIKTQTGFQGSLTDFFKFLRTDPQFFFTDKKDLLMAYRDIAKRADPELVKLFGILPRLPYGVVAIPAYAEKTQTTAYYQPGSLKAGLPGLYYANTYDLKSRPKWEMEALSLHEAVPGHHLQISIAKELEDQPEFRKEADYTAYIEGWGLYAESLGSEMGFYDDPYSKFGQLTYEMWRAIRLVVDTGLHAKGWTRDQAIQYFVENAGKAEHDIAVEVDRYIVWPGQALAYKIGQLKITELKEFAQKTLSDKFDIRAFHDVVLGQGAQPLDVLEKRVREWVDDLKK